MERPFWLRGMENGSIGEARTKEMLIDRFWILERSVDIEGADFIIQRRLTRKSFLDAEPMRLGYVQAKYREKLDGKSISQVHIKETYAFDWAGNPRDEFFLLIHTGIENDKRSYFFRAGDLLLPNVFEKRDDNYYLIAKESEIYPYKCIDWKRVLDEIENAIEEAELIKNREYVIQYLSGEGLQEDTSDSSDKYELNLHTSFNEEKLKVLIDNYKLDMSDIIKHVTKDILSDLTSLVAISDPRKFLEDVEQLHDLYLGDRYSLGDEIKNSLQKFSELVTKITGEQLLDELDTFDEKYNELESKGLLDVFIEISKRICGEVISSVSEIKGDEYYQTSLKISISNKKRVSFRSKKTINIAIPSTTGIKITKSGSNTIDFLCNWFLPDTYSAENKSAIVSYLHHYYFDRFAPSLVIELLKFV